MNATEYDYSHGKTTLLWVGGREGAKEGREIYRERKEKLITPLY